MPAKTQIGPRWASQDWPVMLPGMGYTFASVIREVQCERLEAHLKLLKSQGQLNETTHDRALLAADFSSFVIAYESQEPEN